MGCTDSEESSDIVADMQWDICRNCGLIQLHTLMPLDLLYYDAHGSGSVGRIWSEHHTAFACFMHQFQPSSVLEIGGSHGVLSVEYHRIGDVRWHIVEPNPRPVPSCRATFTSGFFTPDLRFERSFDMVVHSHVFEHIYHPHAFLSSISKHLVTGTMMCFSMPNLQVQLERKYSNCLGFEHTIFLTEPYVGQLLAIHGFELVQRVYFLEDHSIFFAARKVEGNAEVAFPGCLYAANLGVFERFAAYNRTLALDMNARTASPELAGSEIYLFGSHVFSQMLIALGLRTERLHGILDNDPGKLGKRLYGSTLFVDSPQKLKGKIRPAVILKAGAYTEEIREDILKNINPTTQFLE
jgi:2-polyprenyl-3-methyl-5-hydroxy-6-metoxy-1,4-benzoquinol methylase